MFVRASLSKLENRITTNMSFTPSSLGPHNVLRSYAVRFTVSPIFNSMDFKAAFEKNLEKNGLFLHDTSILAYCPVQQKVVRGQMDIKEYSIVLLNKKNDSSTHTLVQDIMHKKVNYILVANTFYHVLYSTQIEKLFNEVSVSQGVDTSELTDKYMIILHNMNNATNLSSVNQCQNITEATPFLTSPSTGRLQTPPNDIPLHVVGFSFIAAT